MASTTSSATSRDQICCIPHDSARKTSKVFVRSGEYGKHAIASQHMCAGTVVFQCVPLAHSLLVPTGMAYDDSDEDTRRRCARCFLRENDDKLSNDGSMNRLKRCSKCKMVYYCSRSCQAEDWIEQHKLECQYYDKRKTQPSVPMMVNSAEEDAIPLLLRTFNALKHLQTRTKYCEEHFGIISCGRKHFSTLSVSAECTSISSLNDLSTNSAFTLARECMKLCVSTKHSERSSNIVADVWGYKENRSGDEDGSNKNLDASIQRTLSAFKKNNFAIVDSLHAPIGEGIYPSAALLNHSCHPNCILRYEMRVTNRTNPTKTYAPILQIIACRDIIEGEELTHSYVDLALPTSERRSRLLQTHGFKCDCARCNNECFLKLPELMSQWVLWPLHQKLETLQAAKSSMKKDWPAVIDTTLDDAIFGRINIEHNNAYKSLIQQSQYFHQQATNCMIDGDVAGELKNLKGAIALFEHYEPDISPFNYKLYSIRCSYLSALLASGNVHGALKECEHIVSFLAVVFSHVKNHPLLGLQLYTLGDLYSSAINVAGEEVPERRSDLSLKQKRLLAYAWARDVMSVTHGRSNAMVQALEENLLNHV